MNLMPAIALERMQSMRLMMLLLLLSVVTVVTLLTWKKGESNPGPGLWLADLTSASIAVEASRDQVERTCAKCHALPPPELFSKRDWPREVDRGFRFLREDSVPADAPSFASVVAYYQRRAPESLPVLERTVPPHELPVRFQQTGYRPPLPFPLPGVANVRFVHLSDERKLDVLACDMVNGLVLLLKPYEPAAELRIVSAAVSHPAHAEVVDLNRDGIKDLVVANLGAAMATDDHVGSVVWLKGVADGSFTPITLAAGLGRVADAQAADFDGDGDLDLVAAEFGWLKIGRILLLDNRTIDPSRPVFVPSKIDPRHGTIHVPVADLNGDGRPDFVALLSQEHETVVAFLNTGDHRFRPEVIHDARHPAFGSTGIQLIDLDGDGDLDVLLTNGDSMDAQMLRPYHGVQWLENRGSFPFVCHPLTSLYGVHRAVAADLDLDGDLDIVAVCFLPGDFYRRLSRERDLDAMVVLEQTAPGRFVRHSLETATCNYSTCDLGDFDGDGKIDLVTANFLLRYGNTIIDDQSDLDWVVLRKNLGRPGTAESPSGVTIRTR